MPIWHSYTCNVHTLRTWLGIRIGIKHVCTLSTVQCYYILHNRNNFLARAHCIGMPWNRPWWYLSNIWSTPVDGLIPGINLKHKYFVPRLMHSRISRTLSRKWFRNDGKLHSIWSKNSISNSNILIASNRWRCSARERARETIMSFERISWHVCHMKRPITTFIHSLSRNWNFSFFSVAISYLCRLNNYVHVPYDNW